VTRKAWADDPILLRKVRAAKDFSLRTKAVHGWRHIFSMARRAQFANICGEIIGSEVLP